MKQGELKQIIIDAHMAGQHNTGIDASNYEALVYYNKLKEDGILSEGIFTDEFDVKNFSNKCSEFFGGKPKS